MNHGHCINCWWYKAIRLRYHTATEKGLREWFGYGRCYMHPDNEDPYSIIDGDSYCPDYFNRKSGEKEQKMTLDEWIEGYEKHLHNNAQNETAVIVDHTDLVDPEKQPSDKQKEFVNNIMKTKQHGD